MTRQPRQVNLPSHTVPWSAASRYMWLTLPYWLDLCLCLVSGLLSAPGTCSRNTPNIVLLILFSLLFPPVWHSYLGPPTFLPLLISSLQICWWCRHSNLQSHISKKANKPTISGTGSNLVATARSSQTFWFWGTFVNHTVLCGTVAGRGAPDSDVNGLAKLKLAKKCRH